MITLIHGSNHVASRKRLTGIIEDKQNSQTIWLEEFDAVKFKEACEARSLFTDKTLVVVSADKLKVLDFFDDALFVYLQELPESADVLFWVGEKVAANRKFYKVIKELGQICFFEETEEKPFDFLDALAAKNPKKAYQELQVLIDQGESEIKLAQLIAWELRILIKVKNTEENPGLHPFVYKKSKRFAKDFSLDDLRIHFCEVTQADLDMKTGKDPRLVLDTLIYQITRG